MPSNQYSPTAEQPYQPTVAPDVVPASPSPAAPQNPAPTGIQAAGNISHVGAVAGIADNVLRGFMQGRAQRDARQAMTVKRNTDMMEASYNSAASQLLQMHRDGVDPNSQEYKQAKDAVDGAFAAKNTYYAQHVLAGDQKPKKGKKGQEEPTTIGQMVQSKDPAIQAKGWLLLQQKAGPPVFHQIASSSTPAAVAGRATENTNAQAAGVTAQNNLKYQQDISRKNEILSKPEDQRTKAENDELSSITERMTPLAKPIADRPGDVAKKAADDVFRKMEDPKYEVTDRDKFVLRVGGYDVTPDTKVQVTTRGEIISSDKDGNYKVLRGPQREYENKAELGGDGTGKPKRGTPAQFSQVEKDTHADYQKAKDKYQNAINGIDDAAAKEAAAHAKNSLAPLSWTPERIKEEKKKAADALEEENKSIASLNSSRTRDLGGIPSEDQEHPAAAAHEPDSTHGSDSNSNFVTQSLQGKKVKGMLSPGNVDITNRPNIQNPDGSHSSTFSMSSEFDGKEVLYPGVGDGTTYPARQLTQKEAAEQYRKTGKNFGTFKDAASATAYGHTLHEDQQKFGNKAHGQDAPPGATAPVYGEDGHTLIGYVVDGGFQDLKK